MKKLLFATALVASVAAFADPINAISFEGYAAGYGFTNGVSELNENGQSDKGVAYFCYKNGDQDGSTVKAYGGNESLTAPDMHTAYFGALELTNNKYLDLSTEGGILWRSINPVSGSGDLCALGVATNVSDGIYLDTLVQFTPTEDNQPPELDTETDKLAIWLNVDSTTGATNLMVKAAVIDALGEPVPTVFTITNKTISAGTWYRLTVKAINDIIPDQEIPGFQIRVDGDLLLSDTITVDSTYLEYAQGEPFETDLLNGGFFASLLGISGSPTLQAVGFKGSGALDEIVWTTEDPFPSGGGADWVADATQIAAGTSAATQYPSLAGSALASADAKQLTEWAQTNNVAFADAVSAAGGDAAAQQAIVEAFLLNCQPVAATVATEKAAFKAYITFDGSGNPVVTTAEGKIYNGTLQLKGKANLTDATWTDVPNNTASSTYHFYMFELSL